MTREEVQDLFNFAQRLGTTPRHALVRAARMAGQEAVEADQHLHRLRETGIRFCPIADDCANLLLTPVASYAQDTLGSALESLWQDARQAAE